MGAATTPTIDVDHDKRPTRPVVRSHDASRVLPLLGRICLSTIFLLSAPGLFSPPLARVAASHGVPLAGVAVPLAGVIAAAGGLSVLFGYKAKIGGALLLIFLIPVTFFMHRFWSLGDPTTAQAQLITFLKNVGLMGGALLVTYFGAGPISADAQMARTRVRNATSRQEA